MENTRGSEWRKWDLHVHTPGTAKNDQFGCQQDVWDAYIEALENADIDAFGITDYFSLENYYKVKEYQDKGRLKGKFIVPNVELRMFPVTEVSKPINIHVIFDPNLSRDLIDREFFMALNFEYNNSNYSCVRENLIALGRAYDSHTIPDDEVAKKLGIGQYHISYLDLKKIIDKPIFKGHILVALSNSNKDGNSGLQRDDGALQATRDEIYRMADVILSGNKKDIEYFSNKGKNAGVCVQTYGKQIPCVTASDAHKICDVGHFQNDCPTWIKSDLTFEGLRQIICEPQGRVRIQSSKPDEKADRLVISDISILDKNDTQKCFGSQKIFLNSNLNSIIGGKSSGKSLLLHSIAAAIDNENVKRIESKLKIGNYEDNFKYDFIVTWNDGVKTCLNNQGNEPEERRKVTYIPQLYINYLAEKDSQKDLDELIFNILRQNKDFYKEYEGFIRTRDSITQEILYSLNDMLSFRTEALDLQHKIQEIGKSVDLQKSIDKINAQIIDLTKQTTLTESEQIQYLEYVKKKDNLSKEITHFNILQDIALKISAQIDSQINSLVGRDSNDESYIKACLTCDSNIPEDFAEIFKTFIKHIHDSKKNLEQAILEYKLKEKIDQKNAEIIQLTKENKLILDKLQSKDLIINLQKTLEIENNKLITSQSLEDKLKTYSSRYKSIKTSIKTKLRERTDNYLNLVKKINDKYSCIYQDIQLVATSHFPVSEYPFINLVNRISASGDLWRRIYNINNGEVERDAIEDLFVQALKIDNGDLVLRDNDQYTHLRLKQICNFDEIMKAIVQDSEHISFDVKYQNDTLLQMSPGKKGTVLLLLFLQLSSAEYPILIDQPEDNLDNRTIYDLLCKMIKEKKSSRQIIIVSHNANIVVTTDSENVIVANQYGQHNNERPYEYKFEYINGALENTFDKSSDQSLTELQAKGIREHVCDILEGGEQAFERREQKYGFK